MYYVLHWSEKRKEKKMKAFSTDRKSSQRLSQLDVHCGKSNHIRQNLAKVHVNEYANTPHCTQRESEAFRARVSSHFSTELEALKTRGENVEIDGKLVSGTAVHDCWTL